MGPIAILGAAIFGGLVAKAISSGDSATQKSSENKAADSPRPQSYVVTPISRENLSASESVRKFVV